MTKIPKGMILRPEWVSSHNVKCEECGGKAYATHYDEEWESHEYCETHYPEKTRGQKNE